MSPAVLMNVHRKAIREAAIKVSGLCSFTLLFLKMRVDSRGAVCDKARHWWRKQQGPHTLRPISMVQHIKLSFTDKRHSAPLLVTLVLQQVVAEWEMASLCLNHCSTYLLSTLSFLVKPKMQRRLNISQHSHWNTCNNQQEDKECTVEYFDYFFSRLTSRKCKCAPLILVPMLIESLFSISNGN